MVLRTDFKWANLKSFKVRNTLSLPTLSGRLSSIVMKEGLSVSPSENSSLQFKNVVDMRQDQYGMVLVQTTVEAIKSVVNPERDTDFSSVRLEPL